MLYNEGDLLQAILDIQNYLADHNFTYGDALDLLKMCEAELNATMDHYAYPTFEDWAKNNRLAMY